MQAAWAVGPGAGAIDQVYACSGSLNGEAVLVFVRALCAVSQEELNPSHPTDIPRWGPPSVHVGWSAIGWRVWGPHLQPLPPHQTV